MMPTRVNAGLPETLARETYRHKIKLIQISTDAVFDGKSGKYKEEDPVSPQNVYAKTKHAGEIAVLNTDSRALVCRVNFYGWSISGRRSLAEWFLINLPRVNRSKVLPMQSSAHYWPPISPGSCWR